MTGRPAFAVTSTSRTAAAAAGAAAALGSAGGVRVYEVTAGGRDFEAAVRAGRFAGAIDLALDELARSLAGGSASDRLTAAAEIGTPQVLVPGGCDDLSPQQIERLAKDVAQKASASRGPVAIAVPRAAWSDGRPLDPALADIFLAALRLWLRPGVAVHACPMSIGEPAFAEIAAGELLRLISMTGHSC